jgi:hypothetical protein
MERQKQYFFLIIPTNVFVLYYLQLLISDPEIQTHYTSNSPKYKLALPEEKYTFWEDFYFRKNFIP